MLTVGEFDSSETEVATKDHVPSSRLSSNSNRRHYRNYTSKVRSASIVLRQALAPLSEGGPNLACRALSEVILTLRDTIYLCVCLVHVEVALVLVDEILRLSIKLVV